jgi:hypothetical protein
MTWSEIAVVVVLALGVLVWWVWVAASRLDRLHRKVAASRSALDNQLVRRASVAAELATTGVLDPVSSVLVADAAWSALSAGGYGEEDLVTALPDLAPAVVAPADRADHGRADGDGTRTDLCAELRGAGERELAESELSRTLRTALDDGTELLGAADEPFARELLEALTASWYRVELSRRFHNEAVAQTQRVRRKALVRLLRLAGHAAMPRTVEIDDGWPDGLPRPGQVV